MPRVPRAGPASPPITPDEGFQTVSQPAPTASQGAFLKQRPEFLHPDPCGSRSGVPAAKPPADAPHPSGPGIPPSWYRFRGGGRRGGAVGAHLVLLPSAHLGARRRLAGCCLRSPELPGPAAVLFRLFEEKEKRCCGQHPACVIASGLRCSVVPTTPHATRCLKRPF